MIIAYRDSSFPQSEEDRSAMDHDPARPVKRVMRLPNTGLTCEELLSQASGLVVSPARCGDIARDCGG